MKVSAGKFSVGLAILLSSVATAFGVKSGLAPRFRPLTPYAKEVLKRVHDEIRRSGGEVSVKRTEDEVTLSEVGFDIVERVRVLIGGVSTDHTSIIERKGAQSTLVRHMLPNHIFQTLDIIDEQNYDPFILAKDRAGYFVVARSNIAASFGPLEEPPRKIGRHWVGKRTAGWSAFLRPDWQKVVSSKIGPPFYGYPQVAGESYVVNRDEEGKTLALVSADDPTEYSIEFTGAPKDVASFWQVTPQAALSGDKKTKAAFINKHNLTQSIGFDTFEDLGNAYLLKPASGWETLIDKTDVTNQNLVIHDDGKNLSLWTHADRYSMRYCFAQRTNPANVSVEYKKRFSNESHGAYLVDVPPDGKQYRLISADDVSVHSIAFSRGPWHDGDKWIVQAEEGGPFYAIPKNNLGQHSIQPGKNAPAAEQLMEEAQKGASD